MPVSYYSLSGSLSIELTHSHKAPDTLKGGLCKFAICVDSGRLQSYKTKILTPAAMIMYILAFSYRHMENSKLKQQFIHQIERDSCTLFFFIVQHAFQIITIKES